ncbi:MAG TPA: HAMP domain-containing sensor histidine kinase [Aquabacterium sp.]|uniref:sensor histidine kinase n=1 Tax=Aquabacterium sp. TaxID=1872578 RepID=UPI002E37A19F|nr:HAMP domain-containing sensor histidine kinase [Aquabacterium sp.]HEX5356138.1 HAMP domain-containing sensor histidine kinase [Aquabacterium sp.]
MKTLALRIYLTVVTVLLVFALVSGWLAQHNMEHERSQVQSMAVWQERAAAWGELLENSLPAVTEPESEQARVFLDWADRLRLPMALDTPKGGRIATSPILAERLERWPELRDRMQQARLSDGRVLWIMRPGIGGRPRTAPGFVGPGGPGGPEGLVGGGPPPGPPGLSGSNMGPHEPPMPPPRPEMRPWFAPLAWMLPNSQAHGVPALILSLILLFVAVAVGAWPVANRLTRRLQALRTGVEAFGAGELAHRVAVEGKDEVAALAGSFNEAAQRIEDLVTSNRNLLANASHELRSPLARLKMAVSIMGDMPPDRAAQLKEEIHQDIRELDALVEEVLLASRLDARPQIERGPVDLLGLVTEEALRVDAEVLADDGAQRQSPYQGDDRLLRRAVRNLLENARRYGGPQIQLELAYGAKDIEIRVCDRGPGVPDEQRDRIFEPFYRLPGHAEHAGGVGLGLSLVRQIAQRHGGQVRCEAREGGGSRFIITLPAAGGR